MWIKLKMNFIKTKGEQKLFMSKNYYRVNGTYDADPSSNSGLKLYPGLCSIERISKCNFVTMVG